MRLKPQPNAEDQARFAAILTFGVGVVGGFAVGAIPGHAEIRRELPADFIAQPQTGFGAGQPGTDTPLRVVLTIDVQLGSRLQNQPVGEQDVVVAFSRTAVWPPSPMNAVASVSKL